MDHATPAALIAFPKTNPRRKPRRMTKRVPKRNSPARSVRIVAGLRLLLAPWLWLVTAVLAGAGALRFLGL